MHIQRITKDATLDDLSRTDYQEIYQEIRQYDEAADNYAISLDKFVELIGSQFTKATWSKYHRGELELNRTMRNELRKAIGRQPLALTIAEATQWVSPDAEVIQIGDDVPDRILLIGTEKPLAIAINGPVTATVIDAPVTEVTRPARAYPPIVRPVATPEQNAARLELAVKWADVINAGLDVLRQQQEDAQG